MACGTLALTHTPCPKPDCRGSPFSSVLTARFPPSWPGDFSFSLFWGSWFLPEKGLCSNPPLCLLGFFLIFSQINTPILYFLQNSTQLTLPQGTFDHLCGPEHSHLSQNCVQSLIHSYLIKFWLISLSLSNYKAAQSKGLFPYSGR